MNQPQDSTMVKLEATGLHDRYDVSIEFEPDITVIHGVNGTGKTTLLHVLANMLNGDFMRFCFLDFEHISLRYSNGVDVSLVKNGRGPNCEVQVSTAKRIVRSFSYKEAFEIERHFEQLDPYQEPSPTMIEKQQSAKTEMQVAGIPTPEAAYFPAFRTMLEAWVSSKEMYYTPRARYQHSTMKSTFLARELFGRFVPNLKYPSPRQIEMVVSDEIREAQFKIGSFDSQVLSDVFVKIFSVIFEHEEVTTEDTGKLMADIATLTNEFQGMPMRANFSHEPGDRIDAFAELRKLIDSKQKYGVLHKSAAEVLEIYREALSQRIKFQRDSLANIERFFNAVNAFLNEKRITYMTGGDSRRRHSLVGVQFPDDSWARLQVLSSGERQLLTMLYAATTMSQNPVVLIDEPELSLHIDWQNKLLSKMLDQLGNRQIVVCTHSPTIASNHVDRMKELRPNISSRYSLLPLASAAPEEDEE